jgi:HD superfamily phosphohydrolase
MDATEQKLDFIIKRFGPADQWAIVDKALMAWLPHPLMIRVPNSYTRVGQAVQRVISEPWFTRLSDISQVGKTLSFLSQGRMPAFTVVHHTWTVYDLMERFCRNSEVTIQDLEVCRMAAILHDVMKPAWTPISEVFMVKNHEELLSDFRPARTICERYHIPWEEVTNTVRGEGRLGRLLESEGDLDKLAYVGLLSDLLATTAYDSNNGFLGFGMREALRLVSRYRIVHKADEYHLCLDPTSDGVKLFVKFMQALVNQYAMFLDKHTVIFEGLAFRALEEAIETEVIPLDWFNSLDQIVAVTDSHINARLNSIGSEEEKEHVRSLWNRLMSRNVWRYACLEIPYKETPDELVKRILELRQEMKVTRTPYLESKFRRLTVNLQNWIARSVGAKRKDFKDFIVIFRERLQPDFRAGYDVEQFGWHIKILNDGLELASTFEPLIEELKKMEKEQLCRVMCIVPSKYYTRATQLRWEEACESLI